MASDELELLRERVSRLEEQVARLERERATSHAATADAAVVPGGAADIAGGGTARGGDPAAVTADARQPPTAPRPAARVLDRLPSGDAWIGKAGIGLVILSVAFLFRMAVDFGWITPLVRVLLGATAGAGGIVTGLRLGRDQALLRRLLQGGGLAVLYLTLFAAVQLYGLVPAAIGWPALLGLSVLGFVLARMDAHPALAWAALAGGLQGPFTLGIGSQSALLLHAYINGLVALTLFSSIRGVRPRLAWGAFLLGGGAVWFAHAGTPAAEAPSRVVPLLSMVLPVLGSLAALWALPFRRGEEDDRNELPVTIATANLVFPWAAVGWLAAVLELDDTGLGTGLVVAAVVVALAGLWLLRSWDDDALGGFDHTADIFAVPAFLLLVGGTGLLLRGEPLYLVLLVIAASAAWIGHGRRWQLLEGVGVLLAAVQAVWLLGHLTRVGFAEVPVLNWPFVLLVATIAAAAFLAGQRRHRPTSGPFLAAGYVGVLVLVLQQLGGMTAGQAVVSIVWSCLGIGLILRGMRDPAARRGITAAGRITLALVLAKLFLVDLTGLDVTWRTLAFFLVGGLFLLLSYIQGRAAATRPPEPEPERPGVGALRR